MSTDRLHDLLDHKLGFAQRILDSLDDPIFVKDRQHRLIVVNNAFCAIIGRSRSEIVGKSDPDFFPPEQVAVFHRLDSQLFESGAPNENEEVLTAEDGEVHTIWTRKYPIFDGEQLLGLIGIISDITSLRNRLDSIGALERTTIEQRARIEAQQELIQAMQIPVITVWDGILLVPLVGEVSEHRASLVLERLLDAISRNSIRLVFLDVSGVPTITASSATTLLEAVTAARLLGARAEIVGVGPSIARLLVEQDVDFTKVRTRASLRDGLRAALLRVSTEGE